MYVIWISVCLSRCPDTVSSRQRIAFVRKVVETMWCADRTSGSVTQFGSRRLFEQCAFFAVMSSSEARVPQYSESLHCGKCSSKSYAQKVLEGV